MFKPKTTIVLPKTPGVQQQFRTTQRHILRRAVFTGLALTMMGAGLYAWYRHTHPQSPTASGADETFCLAGCPTGMSSRDVILEHHILKLSNNPATKFADWVAYKVDLGTMGSGCGRTWARDPDLDPASTLSPGDYRGLRSFGYDRGHQAPLASLCGSPNWLEADLLSNITPQEKDLNEGAWENLEDAERRLAKTGVTVFSITGPLYEHSMAALPSTQKAHVVPSGYWKVVTYRPDQYHIRAAAFIMLQETPRGAAYCAMHVKIAESEKRSGLNFFPNMAAADKRELENPVNQRDMLVKLGCP